MKPICVKCQRFYTIKKNGVAFIESMPGNGQRPKPGTAEPHKWFPYKVWMGDLWECKGCGSEVISGVGTQPISEHYKPGFEQECERAEITINDC